MMYIVIIVKPFAESTAKTLFSCPCDDDGVQRGTDLKWTW